MKTSKELFWNIYGSFRENKKATDLSLQSFLTRHRARYENQWMLRKKVYSQDLERAQLTAKSVPEGIDTILEIGSGGGLIINALKEAGYDPVAYDISRTALEYIKTSKRIQGSAALLPFPASTFDVVLACELLEHLPISDYRDVLDEIARVAKRYVLITVPYHENLEWNYARCPSCGCIFNGACHVRSFCEGDMLSLLKHFRCINLKGIVPLLRPDRTIPLELFVRHRLAMEYLYYSPSVKCPLCFSNVDKKPERNWIGWIAAGIRYGYRFISKSKPPCWYLAVYKKNA